MGLPHRRVAHGGRDAVTESVARFASELEVGQTPASVSDMALAGYALLSLPRQTDQIGARLTTEFVNHSAVTKGCPSSVRRTDRAGRGLCGDGCGGGGSFSSVWAGGRGQARSDSAQ